MFCSLILGKNSPHPLNIWRLNLHHFSE